MDEWVPAALCRRIARRPPTADGGNRPSDAEQKSTAHPGPAGTRSMDAKPYLRRRRSAMSATMSSIIELMVRAVICEGLSSGGQ